MNLHLSFVDHLVRIFFNIEEEMSSSFSPKILPHSSYALSDAYYF
jgi:hypothetical protein